MKAGIEESMRSRVIIRLIFPVFIALHTFTFCKCLLAQSAYVVSTELSKNGKLIYLQIESFNKISLTDQEKRDLNNIKEFIEDPVRTDLDKLNWEVFKRFDEYFKRLDIVLLDLEKAIQEAEKEEQSLKTLIKAIEDTIKTKKFNCEGIVEQNEYCKTKAKYDSSKKILTKQIEALRDKKKTLFETPRDKANVLASEIRSNSENLLVFSEDVAKGIEATEKSKDAPAFAFSEAAIIQALTVAIIKQTLEGLLSMIMHELLGDDTNPKYQLVRFCFPKTIDILNKLKIYSDNSISTIDDAIVLSVKEDLKDLPKNLTDKKHYDKINSTRLNWLKSLPDRNEFGYLALGFQAFEKIKSGYHPAELLSHLKNYYTNNFPDGSKGTDTNVSKMLKWADLFASNLTVVDSEGDLKWIEGDQLEAIFDFGTDGTFKSGDYFWGYLYQVSKDKSIGNLRDKMKKQNYSEFKKHTYNFVTAFKDLYNLTKSIAARKKFEAEDISKYSADLYSIILASTEIVKLYDPSTKNGFNDFLNKYEGVHATAQNALNGQYALILPSLVKLFPNLDTSSVVKEAYRYTNLFTGIASAKSQDELNYVIEKTISTSGGYMRKNNGKALIALNSYPGFFFGGEIVKPYTNVNWGLTVPIGLYFQTRKEIGLYLQVLDLAAPVNYSFAQNVSTIPTDITFGQLISPGLFFVLNLSEYYPIRLNLGLSLTPDLREITTGEVSGEKENSFRFGLSVTYDLPLWYFWENSD